MLEVESNRVGRTFRHYEQEWRAKAVCWKEESDMSTDQGVRGQVAYASRQATVFGRLAAHAELCYSRLCIEKLQNKI